MRPGGKWRKLISFGKSVNAAFKNTKLFFNVQNAVIPNFLFSSSFLSKFQIKFFAICYLYSRICLRVDSQES